MESTWDRRLVVFSQPVKALYFFVSPKLLVINRTSGGMIVSCISNFAVATWIRILSNIWNKTVGRKNRVHREFPLKGKLGPTMAASLRQLALKRNKNFSLKFFQTIS
jgi:hypothetical protein